MDDHQAGTVIEIPELVVSAMWAHAQTAVPDEACGLLAGRDSAVRMAYCLTNIAASPSRYTVDPTGHFGALQHAERNGWDLIGVFHSHPHGPAVPSATDIAGALEPGWHYLILGFAGRRRGELRAYRIREGAAWEEDVVTTNRRFASCS